MILDDLIVLSEVLALPKRLFFHPFSTTFSDPFPDPPLGDFFGPFWGAKVPTYTHRVDFGALLAPPWAPKSTLGATRVGQKVKNGHAFFPRWGSRGRPGRALRSKRVPGVIFNAFILIFDGFWAPGGHFFYFLMILDGISMILGGF